MKRKIATVSFVGVFSLLLVLPAFVASQAPEGGSSTTSANGLRISFTPVKPVFRTSERIQFRVIGNKPFYLYLVAIDKEKNVGYVLLPNASQRQNYYEANREHLLPATSVKFSGDSPGAERVIMVACTKKLNPNLSKFSKEGVFYSGDANSIEGLAKALRVKEAESDQQVVDEVSLVIVAEGLAK